MRTMNPEDRTNKKLEKFFNGTKRHKMGRDILNAITPIFQGESIEDVDNALSSGREMLMKECLFSLRSSTKRQKTQRR
jgi:hypothetical protein